MTLSRQIKAIRAALADLANDTSIADRARLRALELIETDIWFIADLQARLPKRASEDDDLDGNLARIGRAG